MSYKFGKCVYCDKEGQMFRTRFGLICSKHQSQLRHHGKIFERTCRDKNEYRVEGDVAFISLYNRNGDVVAETKVDLVDIERILQHKWCVDSDGYAISTVGNKQLKLHRFVFGDTNMMIDHIDRDKLNNTKSNLRECTASQNSQNVVKSGRKPVGGFKGVNYQRKQGTWRARICVNGDYIYLGTFKDFEDAKRARIEAENKYFKEFSPHLMSNY